MYFSENEKGCGEIITSMKRKKGQHLSSQKDLLVFVAVTVFSKIYPKMSQTLNMTDNIFAVN